MAEERGHFCPGCGAPQKVFLRYPWYVCQPCLKTATDGGGRALEFSNTGFGGGFQWRYAKGGDWVVCGHVVAKIRGRPVLVGEARFGGIVAEPLPDRPLGSKPHDVIDLRGPELFDPAGRKT